MNNATERKRKQRRIEAEMTRIWQDVNIAVETNEEDNHYSSPNEDLYPETEEELFVEEEFDSEIFNPYIYSDTSSDDDDDDDINGRVLLVAHTPSQFTSTSSDCQVTPFIDDFAACVIDTKIPFRSVDKLLAVFSKHFPEQNLPLSSKTLIRNYCSKYAHVKNCEKEDMGSGKFIYLGITDSLCKRLLQGYKLCGSETGTMYSNLLLDALNDNARLVTLMIGIDGLPIFKASNIEAWPILIRVNEVPVASPILAGLYVGTSKPPNPVVFLKQLTDELAFLMSHPFEFNEHKYHIRVYCITADAPARSFLKGTVQFNSYFGCDYCCQRGIWSSGFHVAFPLINCAERTLAEFENVPNTHVKIRSPLCDIMNIIEGTPPDYMHLCLLGIMRRLLYLWTQKPFIKHAPYKLSASKCQLLSEDLVASKHHLPREFHRKGRPISLLDRWKAVELRNFLLYLGPVFLKKYLPESYYHHFLCFHVAMVILIGDHHKCIQSTASEMISKFIQEGGVLYGDRFHVYNVHVLSHLTKHAIQLGQLDFWSAFPFETFLYSLKKMVRSPSLPMEQIVNRIVEMEDTRPYLPDKKTNSGGLYFSEKSADNVVFYRGSYYQITSLNGQIAQSRKFTFCRDLFTFPIPSSVLNCGYFKLSNSSHSFNLLHVVKAIAFPTDNNESVLFPFCCSTIK
jgi:hypothetical protein